MNAVPQFPDALLDKINADIVFAKTADLLIYGNHFVVHESGGISIALDYFFLLVAGVDVDLQAVMVEIVLHVLHFITSFLLCSAFCQAPISISLPEGILKRP